MAQCTEDRSSPLQRAGPEALGQRPWAGAESRLAGGPGRKRRQWAPRPPQLHLGARLPQVTHRCVGIRPPAKSLLLRLTYRMGIQREERRPRASKLRVQQAPPPKRRSHSVPARGRGLLVGGALFP